MIHRLNMICMNGLAYWVVAVQFTPHVFLISSCIPVGFNRL